MTSVLSGEPRTSDCQSSVIMMHRDESEFCFYTCSSLEAKSRHPNVSGEDDCLLVSVKLCLWGVICSLMVELRCRMQVCLRSFSTCRLCDTVTVPIPPYLSSLSSPPPPPTYPHTPPHTPPFLSPHTPSPSIISVCSSFKHPAVISTIN